MKKKSSFPFYKAICLLSVCCLFVPLALDAWRTGCPPGADSLSATLLCGSALLLLLPVSEEKPVGSFRFALAACAVCLSVAVAGLPPRSRVLCILPIPAVYIGYRGAGRYVQLWHLFKPTKVWSQVEWHARDSYGLALVLLAAFFPGGAAPPAAHWIFVLPCAVLYGLLVARVVTGRTLFLSHRREIELKELVRGNLRKRPVLAEDNSEEMGRMRRLYDRVVRLMEEKKPFLDEEFSMSDLSGAVFSNRAYLSKTINIISGQNFNQFVNGYRVRYGVELLRQDPSLRIIDVALMSGFHTTVTFNMAFKLHMGETPSRFQERLRLERLPER